MLFYIVHRRSSQTSFRHHTITRRKYFNVNSFPKRQILDSSKLKEFVDDNFKFDENCRKFSKRVENSEGNGEIAHYEQFLLFPQFSKTCTADT